MFSASVREKGQANESLHSVAPDRQSDIYARDLDAVVELHAQTEESLGRRMQLPDMMKPPVLETWVGERSGRIAGAFYIEAVCEPVFIGRDPHVSASARRFAPQVFASLKERGFRVVRMHVPRWIDGDAESIAKEVLKTGFVSTDGEFLHFCYDLTRPTA
jgi:hypothetical protein